MEKNSFKEGKENASREVLLDDVLDAEFGPVAPPIKPAHKLEIFPSIVFLVVGTVQLMGLNTLLNGMYPLFTTVFGGEDHTPTVIAANSTAETLFVFIFIFVNSVKPIVLYAGLSLSLFASLMYGFVAQYAAVSTASMYLHSLGLLFGAASAAVGSAAFGYAAQFPVDYSGLMSTGLAASGFLTFVVWIIGSYAVFDQTIDGVVSSIWLLCGVLVAVAFVAIIIVMKLFNDPSVQSMLQMQAPNGNKENAEGDEKEKQKSVNVEMSEKKGTDEKEGISAEGSDEGEVVVTDSDTTMATDEPQGKMVVSEKQGGITELSITELVIEKEGKVEEGTFEREGLKGVLFRASWVAAISSLNMIITLAVFPTFAPIAWYEVKKRDFREDFGSEKYPKNFAIEFDVLIGILQLVDLIARYLPVVIPLMNVSTKTASFIIVSRLGFVVSCIMSTVYTRSFLADFWYLAIQQSLIALTHGWMCTVCFERIFETVEGNEAKARVAPFALLCIVCGVTAGGWIGIGINELVVGPLH